MPRIVKKPEIRQQELIEIALKQFIEYGYEKTSIRSIVKSAGGEIGMFYHHFSSKEEVFKASLQQYVQAYVLGIKELIEKEDSVDFLSLLDKILFFMQNTLFNYSNMQPYKADQAVLAILHQNAMLALHPSLTRMITIYTERKEIRPPDVELCLLVDFLLFGASGVIHEKNVTDPEKKFECIKKLFSRQLGISKKV